jgi:hypothetical protein
MSVIQSFRESELWGKSAGIKKSADDLKFYLEANLEPMISDFIETSVEISVKLDLSISQMTS